MPNQGRIPKLLIAILDAVGANANPRTKQESTGILDFLFNPNNKTNSLQYDRGNSKYGEVEVKYIPRGTKSTVFKCEDFYICMFNLLEILFETINTNELLSL